MNPPNIFTDLLSLLKVPHTYDYSVRQFGAMSFPTLFGLSHLLKRYGIDSEGLLISDREDFRLLKPPFIACSSHGMVIVTSVTPEEGGVPGHVDYLTQGTPETIPYADFIEAWNGYVFLVSPAPGAGEPDYARHRMTEVIKSLRNIGLAVGILLLFAYLFISNGIYRSWSLIPITALDIAGLIFSFMLVQKTLGIHTRAANKVCGVLQEGGCDNVLKDNASSFFDIFHWSEVGFSYFSVSLLTLLVFPQFTGYLAAINLLCLPYTFWSIWYQKFRAKSWCTLCVSVQATLWLLFAFYLAGGWYRDIFPIRMEFFVLIVTYGTVLLLLNRLGAFYMKHTAGRTN